MPLEDDKWLVTLIGMHWQTTSKPALAGEHTPLLHIGHQSERGGGEEGWLLLWHHFLPTDISKVMKAITLREKREDRTHTEIGGTFRSLVAILVVRS